MGATQLNGRLSRSPKHSLRPLPGPASLIWSQKKLLKADVREHSHTGEAVYRSQRLARRVANSIEERTGSLEHISSMRQYENRPLQAFTWCSDWKPLGKPAI